MQLFGKQEVDAATRVLKSRRLFRYEREDGCCDQFERMLCRELGVSHSLMLSSGMNALICALAALEIGPGDEVIVPAYTFIATPGAVLANRAHPVVADIDESLTLDPVAVEKKITKRTKAIIPVHTDGLACKMEELLEISRRHRIPLVEDVAQAMGGSYRGRPLGSFGKVGCFSFNQFKILTCGEGGALATNDARLYQRAVIHHDPGYRVNGHVGELSAPPHASGSMRASEISGAILCAQLKRLEKILTGLRERKRLMQDILSRAGSVVFPPVNCAQGDCGTTLMLELESGEKSLLLAWMYGEEGIQTRRLRDYPLQHCADWPGILKKHGCDKSLERLSRTVRVRIDLDLSLKQTERLARKMRSFAARI
jgi:dTDP-4-amino-4,6-dideoxygalactose transaminase